ncbi:MAG: FG-GAP-like repeat-containing protein [Bacteroidia bacterium]
MIKKVLHLPLWPLVFLLYIFIVPGKLLSQVSNLSGEDSTIFISHTVFLPVYSFQAGEQNWNTVAADINRDGYPDVISASKTDGKIHINYNDGKGNFGIHQAFATQPQNRAVCIIDANEDGAPDIAAVTLLGKLCILLNDGKGNMGQPLVISTGVMAHDVYAADMNQDGHQDILVACVSGNSVNIHYGDGKGKLGMAVPVHTGDKPRSVRAGDLNGDGLPDIVAGCDDGRVYYHLSAGNGKFHHPQSLRSGAANWGLGLADLDQDGTLDIASASYMDKKLCIHLNKGDGSFLREQEIISGDHNFALVIRDFDLDGDPDIVTCSTVDHAISFHLNNGKGVFGERIELKSGNWNAGIDAADFDGDGDDDIVTASINDQNINIHRNISADERPAEGPRYCIRGKIYNKETGKIIPLAPISIRYKEETLETSRSNASGEYQFCPKPKKTYTLIVRTPGFPLHQEEVTFPEQDITHDIYLSLPKGAFVHGTVRDKDTRRPLPGAIVTLRNRLGEWITEITADEKGYYRQELPFDQGYEASATFPRYRDEFRYFDLNETHHPDGLVVNIELETKVPPNHICISGTVFDDKTREYIPFAGIVIRDQDGNRVKKFRVDAAGHYEVCLPYGGYRFSTIAKGYFFNVSELTLRQSDPEMGKIHDIYLLPLEAEAHIVLENIYYDVDKATLRPESIEELDRMLEIMQQNPTLKVEISGHTDSDASDDYNLVLSDNRAKSVVDYLTAAGIEPQRLIAKGYGEQQPVAPNDTRENKQLNRRTEFKVVSIDITTHN